MKKPFSLVCLLLLFSCTSNGANTGGNDGLAESPGAIAYMRFAEGDELPSEVVIADENGDEQRSVEVEDVLRLMPTQSSNTALVIGGAQGSTVTHVLDVAAGEAQPVSGAEGLATQTPGTLLQGERYMALVSPEGDQVALLDLDDGELTDLTETMGDVNFVAAAYVSPDDTFVAVSTSDGLWLIPTDDPSAGETVSEASTPLPGGFTEDGSKVVFTERTSDGAEVKAVSMDGEPQTIASSEEATLFGVVSPTGDEVAVVDSDSVELIPADGGDPTTTVDLAGEWQAFAYFSSSGDRMILQTGGQDATYELVDLEAGESQEIDELAGLRAIPLPQETSPHWLLFSDVPEAGLLGKQIMALDLVEGDVKSVLSIEDSDFTALQSWSPDGRYVLVASFVNSEATLRLLDLDAGEAREIAKGAVVVGAISHDGDRVVFSEAEETPREARIFTVSTDEGEREDVGEGVFPVWVKP